MRLYVQPTLIPKAKEPWSPDGAYDELTFIAQGCQSVGTLGRRLHVLIALEHSPSTFHAGGTVSNNMPSVPPKDDRVGDKFEIAVEIFEFVDILV